MTVYKDLDLTFNIHPIKKDISITTDVQAIIRSLKNIILTNHYESPFNPDFGSNIRTLLFENISMFTANYIEREIKTVIEHYEDRIKLEAIQVNVVPDQNRYSVSIEFSTLISAKPVKIDFFLNKIR